MSNNKQSVELYTKEQVNKAMLLYLQGYPRLTIFALHITPIEIPSDEEIENHIEDDFLNATEVHKYSEDTQLLMKAMCKAGALWMRDKILGGNK